MRSLRNRLIEVGWLVLLVGTLAFGGREALASARLESCEDCVPDVTDCEQCCIDWNFEHGICPGSGGGYCLCW
jgi:hypothetical protein